jgi:hypothetical protein
MKFAHCGQWAVVLAGCFIAMTGCTQQGSQRLVLERLPNPIYVDHQPVPGAAPAPKPQREKIVVEPVAEKEPTHPWLPSEGISRHWKYIVIHHTASEIGSLKDIHQWHLDKGWEHGCGYDFVIGNGTNSSDGRIEKGPRWEKQIHGAHVRLSEERARQKGVDSNHYNEHGIGIALVGDFEQDRPSPKQMASLVKLVKFLVQECSIPVSSIIGHGDVDQTRCPGAYLSIPRLRRQVRQSLAQEILHVNSLD